MLRTLIRTRPGGGDKTALFVRGGPRGVLCLHGFTGTPFEVRPLAEALAGRGYTVLAPVLAGHCGTIDELACTAHAHGPLPGVHNTLSLYGTWYLPFGKPVVMMRTSGSPGRRLISPDSASAVSATTTSTFAPRSLPSVPAFLYLLVGSRR